MDAHSGGQTNQRETGNVGGQTERNSFGHFWPEPGTLGRDGTWLENKKKRKRWFEQHKTRREKSKTTGLVIDERKFLTRTEEKAAG